MADTKLQQYMQPIGRIAPQEEGGPFGGPHKAAANAIATALIALIVSADLTTEQFTKLFEPLAPFIPVGEL